MRRSVVLAWLSLALLACGTDNGGGGTIDAPQPIIDAAPHPDSPTVVPDAAPIVDSPMVVDCDPPPPPPDAPPAPPIDAPPPPIDAPPPIDSPPGDPCGNGVVDTGETCDIGIAQGNPGACPVDCAD